MSLDTYAQKINEYVMSKQNTDSPKAASKGLLSPNKTSKKTQKQTKDAVTTVGDFVYALRKKRTELKEAKNAA